MSKRFAKKTELGGKLNQSDFAYHKSFLALLVLGSLIKSPLRFLLASKQIAILHYVNQEK